MKSVVGEKGQVTIPKALRDSLGITTGTNLEFAEEDGRLVARKVLARDPIEAMIGLLEPVDVDTEIEAMRGRPWAQELDGPVH